MAANLKDRLGQKVSDLQTVQKEEAAAARPHAAPAASEYTALTTNAMEVLYDNLKHQPLSQQVFDVIKAPSGGSTVFTVNGEIGRAHV